MYCYNCGIKVIDGASFCQGCGASVTQKFPDPVTEHEINKNTHVTTEIYPNPAQVPEFTVMPEPVAEFTTTPEPVTEFAAAPEPVTEFFTYAVPDAEINPTPEQVPNPIPEPFPETVPDSFPDPAQSGGVSVTGITKNEINSYRYDPYEKENSVSRSFTFAETSPADEKPNVKAVSEAKPEKKEKVYFGKAAFVFCLMIITALSVLCGIFAGLYLKSSEKKNITGAFAGVFSEMNGYSEKNTLFS